MEYSGQNGPTSEIRLDSPISGNERAEEADLSANQISVGCSDSGDLVPAVTETPNVFSDIHFWDSSVLGSEEHYTENDLQFCSGQGVAEDKSQSASQSDLKTSMEEVCRESNSQAANGCDCSAQAPSGEGSCENYLRVHTPCESNVSSEPLTIQSSSTENGLNNGTSLSLSTRNCESAKISTTPKSLTQVLTVADDRLSLLSFESDCASSSDPVEPCHLGSSQCTTSDDDDDDPWMSNILPESLLKHTRDIQVEKEALQRSLALLNQKVSAQEQQLSSQEAEFQEALARLRAQNKAQVDKLKSQVETATKEKEAMVVRYAQSEREVINSKKAKEVTDKKIRDLLQERESLQGKVKVLHADRVRACSSLDSKMAELAHTQRENERLKEELINRDIKIKWAQNKLKEESDMHKETLLKLDQTIQRLKETREESEQVRRDCQDMIRRYQEAEEIKSVALDQQLRMKLSELEVQKQERSDQEEVYLVMRRELDAFKKRDKSSVDENNALTVKIQALERERLEHEQTVSKLKETQNRLRQEAVDLHEKLAEAENLGLQLDREREKVLASQREVERLRAAHQDLQNDLEACHMKEGELLEFTQKLTTKTVHLQSEHSLLEVKAQNLEEELSRVNRQCSDLEAEGKKLSQDLSEESRLRREETQLLTRKLAEKTKSVEVLNLKLEEAENEARVYKRRHLTSMKELSRELAQTKKRLEQLKPPNAGNSSVSNHSAVNTPGESLHGSSRTSSSGSLADLNSSAAGGGVGPGTQRIQHHSTNSNNPPPVVAFSTGKSAKSKPEFPSSKHRTKAPRESGVTTNHLPPPSGGPTAIPEITQQNLISKILKLQKQLAKKQEKVEFLEEHNAQLLLDIKKKKKLIQNYILREEAGALSPNTMDQNKAEVLRRGGIMATVYGGNATDSGLTLDLSLEINKKLQEVLEDTLLKNITLKENIDTLGEEIARISKNTKNSPF